MLLKDRRFGTAVRNVQTPEHRYAVTLTPYLAEHGVGFHREASGCFLYSYVLM